MLRSRSLNYFLYAIALAATVLVVVFKVMPVIIAAIASLSDARLLTAQWSFVGAEQYLRLFHDSRFWSSLAISSAYTASIATLATLIGLTLATVLRDAATWSLLLHIAFVLPAAIPSMVAATLWIRLLNPTFGGANQLLLGLGITGPAWLHDSTWALPALIAMGIWREVGLALLLFSAALVRIPAEIEAAAACDGADPVRVWRFVTLPLLRPAIVLAVLTTGLRCFEHFTPFYAMSGGGPARATTSWTLFLYEASFERYDIGYAASAAVVVSIALAVLLGKSWHQARRVWGEGA